MEGRGGPSHQAGKRSDCLPGCEFPGTSATAVPLSPPNPARVSLFRWNGEEEARRGFPIGSRHPEKPCPGLGAWYLGGEWPEAKVASGRPYLAQELPPGGPLGHRDHRPLLGASNYGTLARVCFSPRSLSGRDPRLHPRSYLDAEVPPPQLSPVRTCQLLPCQDLGRPAAGPQPWRAPSPNSAFPVFASPWQPGPRRHVIAPVFW